MSTTTMTEQPQHMRLTLHEAISRKFDKRPDGLIFTRDIKTIFSLMIICLDLQEKPKARSSTMRFLNKHHPFTFSAQEAITTMSHLSLNIESSATSTTLAYSIKPDLAVFLIKAFMSAKLLHTPADRTRAEPKDKVLLQPTPKGVAIVQTYCKVNGIKFNSTANSTSNFTACPAIIRTDFNTMDLFQFEISSITGHIIYSEYFVHLLFTRFLGDSPNVWKSQNSPDELPSLEHRLQMDDEFEFSNFHNQSFTLTAIQNGAIPGHSNSDSSLDKKKSQPLQKKSKRESPFAHTFFTNPESDSHVQYYVSNKGVRLSENMRFQGDVMVSYCFSSKSGWQWLMDCTDIMYPMDAVKIFSLFYIYGLIEPIILSPSTANSKKQIPPSKTALYTPSQKGYNICHWARGNKTPLRVAHGDEILTDATGITLSNEAVLPDNQSSSSNEDSTPPTSRNNSDASPITIKTVLSDPGMRYLFRSHLEHEYCAENLDVYLEIKQFGKKMAILKNVVDAQIRGVNNPEGTNSRIPSRRAIVRLINECLGMAYNVYSSYIAIGAPYQLNIDHLLREQVTDAVLHTTSPLKTRFDEVTRPISMTILESPERAHVRDSPKTPSPIPLESVGSFNSQRVKPLRIMNNKNLSIEIPNSEADITPQNEQVMTPTKEEMTHSLQLLQKLFPLFDKVGAQILRMLENDSFPKFLVSDTFRCALGSGNK